MGLSAKGAYPVNVKLPVPVRMLAGGVVLGVSQPETSSRVAKKNEKATRIAGFCVCPKIVPELQTARTNCKWLRVPQTYPCSTFAMRFISGAMCCDFMQA